MAETQIRQRDVLERVLLETLAAYPDGVRTSDAYDLIAAQYGFPAVWYREIPKTAGYDVLQHHGYSDWRDVPQERLIELVKTEPQWQNELRWARNGLRKKGFLDGDAPSGLWRLTSAGMQAAGRISLSPLPPAVRRISAPRQQATPHVKVEQPEGENSAKSPREALLGKLQLLSNSMPLHDLELLVDMARIIRIRGLPESESQSSA